MMRIAICGGIGSGKSFVTEILRSLGAKVVVADEVNAELLSDPAYVALIANTFPTVVHNKVINKKELADIIYRDESKRRLLMRLAHPRIYERMFSKYQKESLVFYEIPLLSESDKFFDRIWFVLSDVTTRIHRIVLRDNVSEEYAVRVIKLQQGEDELRDIADELIDNSGDMDATCDKVKALYYSILSQLS